MPERRNWPEVSLSLLSRNSRWAVNIFSPLVCSRLQDSSIVKTEQELGREKAPPSPDRDVPIIEERGTVYLLPASLRHRRPSITHLLSFCATNTRFTSKPGVTLPKWKNPVTHLLGPFIQGKVRRVFHKMRSKQDANRYRINGTFLIKNDANCT